MDFRGDAFLVGLSILVLFGLGESTDLVVKTKFGLVEGITKATPNGKTVDAFLGIPYGAPTGGRNRFAPPKEREPWDGTFSATNLPSPCYQAIEEKFKFLGFVSDQPELEDCLKLNVWVPKPRPVKSAVMVWIHGGGFSSGSSDLPLYDGSTLATEENIIVVSINYRLSAFGFLYLEHPDAPGNVGLMDQVLALQWVRKNIKTFGGDPEQVTIFGESAGGASVGFHLIIPASLDLFKNAIMQSGSANCFWAVHNAEKALSWSLRLVEGAGCPTQADKRDEAVRCLQNMNADKFQEALLLVEDIPLRMAFKPVIDGTFIRAHPSEIMSKGKLCDDKNILLGTTAQDGAFMIASYVNQSVGEDSVFTEEQILNAVTKYSLQNEELSGFQADLVKHMYTPWNSVPDDRISAREELLHYFNDRWFLCGAQSAANYLADTGNRVYMYSFDYARGSEGGFMKLPEWLGSVHGDEIPYVFGHRLRNKDTNKKEFKLCKHIMRLWTNFARNGDPNDEYLVTWPKYTSHERLRLRLDIPAVTVDKADRKRECAFWENVFPKSFSP